MDERYLEKRMMEANKGREELNNLLDEIFDGKKELAADLMNVISERSCNEVGSLKRKLPETIGSLVDYLWYLKKQYQNGEMGSEDFIREEKEVLDKINAIVENTEFNGENLLDGDGKISLVVVEGR